MAKESRLVGVPSPGEVTGEPAVLGPGLLHFAQLVFSEEGDET